MLLGCRARVSQHLRYLKISRFNHSCLPNCGVSWDDREGLLQVFAERAPWLFATLEAFWRPNTY